MSIDNKDKMNLFVKEDLKSNLTKFFNEIELSFDYISKETNHKLKCFLKKLDKNEVFLEFTNSTLPILKTYEDKITYIITSKHKLKTSDFEFLNEIVLFNNKEHGQGILDFKVFNNENKNTKKCIVNYLNNIYMAICILELGLENTSKNFNEIFAFVKNITDLRNKRERENEDHATSLDNNLDSNPPKLDSNPSNLGGLSINDIVKSFTNMNFGNMNFDDFNLGELQKNLSNSLDGINEFGKGINIIQENSIKQQKNRQQKNRQREGQGQGQGQDQEETPQIPDLNDGNFMDVFKSLMENKEIMNIASDLTRDIQDENIDPISLLTSLMSGKPNEKLEGLVSNITTKLQEKIKTGKIDQNVLEKEAENILNKFKTPNTEPLD
jgi:hypothetical protein